MQLMTRNYNRTAEHRIAYFITPHGYGHAARASAVMAAIHQIKAAVRFEIFTQVPEWFFQDSLPEPFGHHPLLTDIGLAQKTPILEDVPDTLRLLDDFLPFDASRIREIASRLNRLQCQLVICDIAPMGITVAKAAAVPSILIENFTWDWIYEAYREDAPKLSEHIAYLGDVFDAANYHVQTRPVCNPRQVDLTTPPIGRKIRTPRQQIRQQLGIPAEAKTVMITMGGIPWQYDFVDHLDGQDGVSFIIPGADELIGNANASPGTTGPLIGGGKVVLLPHHSDYYHPDLVNAADAVIGKAGYSTVAEVYNAGIPFGYVGRPKFRETQALTAFIEQEMRGLPIEETQFQSGSWLSSLEELLALPRTQRSDSCGADQIADFICDLLD
jgi:UDP:flavonoid glycosyltransferase YjiC (YdhE family)